MGRKYRYAERVTGQAAASQMESGGGYPKTPYSFTGRVAEIALREMIKVLY
jgi:hypothetical protein